MTDLFFPNQPPTILEDEKRLRAIVRSLSEEEQLERYTAFSSSAATLAPTRFDVDRDLVIAHQCGRALQFPRPLPLVKLALITFGYEEWLRRKYELPGFVEVEPQDIAVDCGAYVGGFSLSAGKVAGQVHAFEPEAANAECARKNLAGREAVRVVEQGLYNCSGQMTLNVSSSSVEHSLLQPDNHDTVATQAIQVIRLADYAEACHIDRFDFVKIEAEGVELEVFEGLGDMRPRKLAIDVSPERNGQSPAAEFRARLEPLGYEVRQRAQVMFARMAGAS